MASEREKCVATLKGYLERTTTDNTLKLSPMKKCMIEVGLKQYASTLESSIWAKHCDKAKKNCPIDKILDVVLLDLADYEAKKKGAKKSKDDLYAEFKAALAKGKPEAKQTKAGAAADAVTARMTDASGYTGSHKERFDASGKGKGIEGRADVSDNSGYVGNYKGAGTFDKK